MSSKVKESESRPSKPSRPSALEVLEILESLEIPVPGSLILENLECAESLEIFETSELRQRLETLEILDP